MTMVPGGLSAPRDSGSPKNRAVFPRPIRRLSAAPFSSRDADAAVANRTGHFHPARLLWV